MSTVFCITVRFLDPVPQFHGRGDDGGPEWPPSPLRLFQSLVCASATRWRNNLFREYARPALQWLEAIRPSIVAPQVPAESFGYRMYVPNNSGDLMTAAWARGDTETSMARFRVEKDVRPTRLTGDAVHYLYSVADATEFAKHRDTLVDAARSVTHLGWGVDMVAGNAVEMSDEEVAKLAGERWNPTPDRSGTQLRVPRADTLDALMQKHEAFLGRLQGDGFRPVPPLTAFEVVGYRRDTDIAERPWVAFNILDPEASKNRSFDTARRCRDVAAWVRNATAQVCEGWPSEFGSIAGFVHGHGENDQPLRGDRADERFMYLPLPSIERRGGRGEYVGAIRRVLIAAPPGFRDRIDWIRRRLPGQELTRLSDGDCAAGENVVGLLNLLPTSDWVLGRYIGPKEGAQAWSTVTPVVLPGYDDPNHHRRRIREIDAELQSLDSLSGSDDAKRTHLGEEKKVLFAALEGHVEGRIREAFRHAGVADALLACAQIAWRNVGFLPGVEPAERYERCDHHKRFSVRHVRVRFARPVRGPLVVGAGRYRGLGLFATEGD